MKRTPLRRKSKRREAEDEVRREVLAALVEERGSGCEAGVLRIAKGDGGGSILICTGTAVDGHEVLTRGRGGSATDPANILLVCRECHTWIHDNPQAAEAHGLLMNSWEAK